MTLIIEIAGGILLAAAVIGFLVWINKPDDNPGNFPP
jgi:hypothetical protein